MSDVPEGYKMSEVGVIPEEWEVKTFGEVMTGFSSGATPYRGRPEYYKGNIRWITSGELNYNVITDTIEKITENAVRNTNLKIHPKGTFLMAITGLEAEGTRGSCGIVGAEATTNQSCMALFPTKELLTEYLFHYYVNYGNSLALEYCQGTKQQSYTAKIVKILPIIVPPTIEEQQAIASALSDVDALITVLGQLITKKRNIKQGAMQQLLTGKKRLPGFGGEWEMKQVIQWGEVITGGTPSTQIKEFWNGTIPWITPTDITNKKDISKTEREITSLGLTSIRKLPYNSVLITCIASIGKNAILRKDGACNQQINAIIPNKEHNADFIYYLIENNKQYLLGNAGITATNIISKKDFSALSFLVPPLPEQQAIAQILSDMDTEIEALEQKRDKYKAIKQGMMQELLTGKMRLV